MNHYKKILLVTVLLAATLTITVQAYESDIHVYIADADYPETVQSGGTLDLEVTINYNFTQAATLNVWVMDGPWYAYETEIVSDVFVDVNEEGPKTVSIEVPAPEEEGDYRYTMDAGWCEPGTTELLPQLGGNQNYNLTFTITAAPVDTGGEDTPDTDDAGGIPGFPAQSLIIGISMVSVVLILKKRTPTIQMH